MFFKKIIFSKDSYWVKLRDKKFDFTTNDKEEIATFVIFIGKNSCGKTTLLDFIRQIINKSKSLKSTPINNNGKEHVFFEFLNNNRQVNEIKLVEPVVEKDNNQNLELFMRLDCYNHDFFSLSQKNNNLTMDIEEFSFYNLPNTNKNDFMKNNFPEIGEYNVRSHYNTPILYSLSTPNIVSSIINFYRESNRFTTDSFAAIDMSNDDIKKHIMDLKSKTIFSTLNAEFNEHNYGITFGVTNDGEKVYINEKDGNVYPYHYLSSGLQKKNSFLIPFHKIKSDIKKKKLNNDSNKTNINFFLDEIENSLCPNEQVLITKKIIDDTTEINQGQKICQFFIATHSPFILKNFLSEERNSDTVIINVETGENILKSEKKKLLLNLNNNVSYDEISYLYYGIPTSNYYISLYEAMKMKFKEKLKKEVNYSNEDKERLLPFYLAKLFDYTDWESFVAKFNDESWRNNDKNKASVKKLTEILNCSFDEVNSEKIRNLLDNKTKTNIEEILKIEEKKNIMLFKKRLEINKDKFKQNKNELIAICLTQLWDENYNSWKEFIKQFDNTAWKENEKNKPIIEKLANLLKCEFEKINTQEIEKLDDEIKNDTQKKLSEWYEASINLCRIKSITKINNPLSYFLLHVGYESLKEKIYEVFSIKSSDKLNELHAKNQKKINVEDLDFLDNLTLLRNMLAHNNGQQNWNIKIFEDKNNGQIVEKSKRTKSFYALFKKGNDFENLLKEQIETIREILINWENKKQLY